MNAQAEIPQRLPFLVKWVAFPLGGLALACFYIMRGIYAYDAGVLMQRGVEADATVIIGGMLREDCHYMFGVGDKSYKGRGSSDLEEGAHLRVVYDPSSPRRNRPADGLWWDIGIFALLMLLWTVLFGKLYLNHSKRRLIAVPEVSVTGTSDSAMNWKT